LGISQYRVSRAKVFVFLKKALCPFFSRGTLCSRTISKLFALKQTEELFLDRGRLNTRIAIAKKKRKRARKIPVRSFPFFRSFLYAMETVRVSVEEFSRTMADRRVHFIFHQERRGTNRRGFKPRKKRERRRRERESA
jgi:hypothetical protein